MNFLTMIFGGLNTLRFLLEELRKFNAYVESREFKEFQENMSSLTKRLQEAKTHEERLNIASELNDLNR